MLPPSALLAPRYWPTWLGLGLLRLTSQLPYRQLLALGRGVGWVALHLLPQRRRIAATNIARCFPERDAEWQRQLLRDHFAALGISLFELALSCWASERRLAPLGHLHGLEHLHQALAQGSGVILLSAHLLPLDIGGRLLPRQLPLSVFYRAHKNAVIEWVWAGHRRRHVEQAIPSSAIKSALRVLRGGGVLWYAPDQNTTPREAVFANFFTIPAATNSGTARLARLTGARVVPYRAVRRRDGSGYDLFIDPPLAHYPSGDLQADTQRINDLIEQWVRRDPEQYLWVHRRFRHRPNRDDPPFY